MRGIFLFLLFSSILRLTASAMNGVVSDTIPCDSLLSFKYTTNAGTGIAEWNGIRNIRAVLPGILYRSGGNGTYNPLLTRPNESPISFQGILNLYEMGFDKVFYLYPTRFASQYPSSIQQLLQQVGIEYRSLPPVNDSLANILLRAVYQTIESPEMGPVLVHCWNGWHMSGLISAYALMQFCDFTNAQALEYWKENTDGHDEGFIKIKNRIMNFKQTHSLQLTARQKLEYCPCQNQ